VRVRDRKGEKGETRKERGGTRRNRARVRGE